MKKVYYSIVVIGVLILIGNWIGFFPIVITPSNYLCNKNNYEDGDVFNPLNDIDINKCEIYIEFALDDIHSDKAIFSGKLYKCDDIEVLKQLKSGFNFVPKGADVATVTSSIYILESNKLVFSSSVVLDKDMFGLQSGCFGWVSKANLIPIFSKFKRVYNPFVIIN